MENNNQHIIDKLNHLIAIAEDGKEGYENAAKDVKDSAMKTLFQKFSLDRLHYATELQEHVQELNGDAKAKGGPEGALHRVWMDIKSVFTSGDPVAIINACITGEEVAVKEYKVALEDTALTTAHRQLISEQLQGIERALASIKAFRSIKH